MFTALVPSHGKHDAYIKNCEVAVDNDTQNEIIQDEPSAISNTENNENSDNNSDNIVDGVDEGDFKVNAGDGVVLEKNDRSLAELHRWKQTGRLIVDPEWQRQYVWDRKRASKLIESFIHDIPVPVIYLAKNEEGKYEVIDGLQRLTSVFDYLNNQFSLRGLELVPLYNGKYFRELDETAQNKLQDATVRTFELSPRTPKDLMFVIFERLNTGGISLNDMEIRNCLFRGKLNTLIKKLADDQDFKVAVNQSNLGKRMTDRTLILRFLAFYERTHHKAKQGLKRFLNEFFETYRNPTNEKLQEYEKQFRKSMKACLTVFGNQAFRLRRADERQDWATRPNAAIFQVIATSFVDYDLGQITRRSDSIFEEYLDLITTDEKWREYVRIATGETNRLSYVFDEWQLRLKAAIGSENPNDSVRCFSRSLKQEMFSQNSNCAICGQRIALVNDAALDHDIHYWRGGKTVPENARIVHRHCNQTRPR